MDRNKIDNEEIVYSVARLFSDEVKRGAYLEIVCGKEPILRQRVEALLSISNQADDFFGSSSSPSRSIPRVEVPPNVAFAEDIGVGSSLASGRYRILRELGIGGCGIVFLAEQQLPVRRQVAIKVIKAGMDTANVIARFEAERQALALMEHPNIAKIFDAGGTEQGRPFFVMELVEGIKITNYCAEGQLSIDERLHHFLQVCDAVQHAHQKGIIHRDLKPSNILVNDGGPKIIDFGIAKATQGKLTEETIYTLQHQFLGTPAYMSPEQADLSGDIDTRTDIYALGVLLYELLAGKPPFDNHQLLTAGVDEMRRIIREKEPITPSRSSLSANRTVIPSDLDWIVLKCLEKDRARRYESASGLAADIRRYLQNESIGARPPSALYKVQKFVRRNRLACLSTVAISAVLVFGWMASAREARRANKAEEQSRRQAIAARQAERAQAVERARAEERLNLSLTFVDRLFRDVGGKLWQIAGTSEVSEMLATNGVQFLDQLRNGSELTTRFQVSLANQYVRLAQSKASEQGNTTADYQSGLQLANRAIGLFENLPQKDLSPESIRQLARAEIIAGTASERLFSFEPAIEHFRRAERWATILTNYPAFETTGLTLKAATAGGCIGDVLLHMGRADEALTNCFLPFLRAMEGRRLSELNPNVFDLSHLYGAHACVARACSELGQHQQALPHRREALRLMELMLSVEPNAAEFLSTLPIAQAELGESLLAGGNLEGLEYLHRARTQAGTLVARDNSNAGFMQTQIEALRLSANAIGLYARASGLPNDQTKARLREAGEHFAQAEQTLKNLPSDDLRQWLAARLDKTRALLLATNSKKSGGELGETRGPPAARAQ